MIECVNCGRIPENGDLNGWQSKTIRSLTGAEFTDWWCPDCAEVQMRYDEKYLMEDMQEVNKYEFIVMRHLVEHGPKYKTYIMQDLIKEFPDEIEHGEYLIPGKEYSDDIDEAIESLLGDGVLNTVKGGLALSEYGGNLYDMFRMHPEVEIDEDLADFIEKLEDKADGMV